MSDTVVYIEADAIGTIILDTPEDINVTIDGTQTAVVTDNTPDVIVVAPIAPELPAIIIGDQPALVVIGDNPVNVTLTTPEITVIGSNAGPRGPEGPQGPPGEGSGDAADVSYANATYANVQEALDSILYQPPEIESFSNSVGTVELGTTITAVTLSWTLNKTMTSLSLDDGIGSVVGLTSKSLIGLNITSEATWTLSAGDGQNTTSAITTVAFKRRRYWGVSPSEELDNAGVLGLSGSELADNFSKSVTYDASGGKYLYFAFPQSFGVLSNVKVGGLPFTDYIVSTLSDFTNASGHTETYSVVRVRNLQTGSAISVNWA